MTSATIGQSEIHPDKKNRILVVERTTVDRLIVNAASEVLKILLRIEAPAVSLRKAIRYVTGVGN